MQAPAIVLHAPQYGRRRPGKKVPAKIARNLVNFGQETYAFAEYVRNDGLIGTAWSPAGLAINWPRLERQAMAASLRAQ